MDSTVAKSAPNGVANQPHSFVFRFFAKDPAKLATLSASLNRSISDIYSFFTQIPANFLVSNGKLDFLRYPLAVESNFDTMVFDEIDMELFATDTFLSTEELPGSESLGKGEDENLFSLMYKEQFVVSLEASIKQGASTADLESFKVLLQNILQNADIEGVTLLSVAFDKTADALPFTPTDVIPENAGEAYAYQPLKLPFVRTNSALSMHDRGWVNEDAELALGCLERDMLTRMEGDFVRFGCLDEEGIEFDTNVMAHRDGTLRVNTTYLCGIEELEQPALVVDANGNPVWTITLLDDTKGEVGKQNLLLSRMVALPAKNDVETTFNSQSHYPVMPMFGDYFGADINYMLLAMKNSNLASWVEYGMECNRDIMADGSAEYEVYLADELGGQSGCFVGNFEQMQEFLARVEKEAPSDDLDAPFDIAEEMGCSPVSANLQQDVLMD